MKILIIGNFHHKNKEGLEKILENLGFIFFYGNINNIKDYDIIYSPSIPIDTAQYKNKKFIFGPHFSVFPNNLLESINNIYNNSIYIQPSNWVVELWKDANNFLPVKQFPFPVNTERFGERKIKNKVFIYFKRRSPKERTILQNFLKNRNIEYLIFDYVKKYNENDYLNFLKESKFGIILDAHESQGFAIQEALSCDVPLLVWNVVRLSQEYKSNYPTSFASSIPYWDSRCGEVFHNSYELNDKFNTFISKLDTYKPRNFILENLSLNICTSNFRKLLDSF